MFGKIGRMTIDSTPNCRMELMSFGVVRSLMCLSSALK